MITKPELQDLLQSTETYRVERTNPTSVTQGVPQDVPQDVTQEVPQDVTQDGTQGGTQDGTQGGTQDDTQGDTQDDTQGDTQDDTLDVWIETQIRKNPKVTTEELAKHSGKGLRTIKRHLAKLAHIKYVGSGYSGHWEITDKNN